MTSPNGVDWEVQRSSYGTDTFDIATITHANGRYLALGYYKEMVNGTELDIYVSLTSEDGKSWTVHYDHIGALTVRSITSIRDLRAADVAFDGVQYVVRVNGYDPLYTEYWLSPDGIVWTKAPNYDPTLFPLYHPSAPGLYAFGNGIYVAANSLRSSTGYTLFISRDGQSWRGQATDLVGNFVSVAFGNGQFVASVRAGKAGYIATSTDGRNWTPRNTVWVNGDVTPYYSIAFGEGLTVAGGHQEVYVFDEQGKVTRIPIKSENMDRILYAHDHFIAFSATNCNSTPFISPDGYTWTPIGLGRPYCLDRMVATDDQVVILGFYDEHTWLITSSDLQTWTVEETNLPARRFGSLAWGNGTFVTVQPYNNYAAGIYVSKDGRNWVQGDPNLPAQLKSVYFMDGRFVAFGTDGSYTSEDGMTWSFPYGSAPELHRAAYSGEYYLAVGGSYISLSADGSHWVSEYFHGGFQYNDVIFAGDRFIVAGGDRLLTAKVPPCRVLFWDVPASHPACKPVDKLAIKGVISGYSDHTFRPNNQVTRAEIAKMVTVALGHYPNPSGRVTFRDVAGHWALTQGYLQKAVELGIITGYSPQTFGPNDPLTRAQLIKITAAAVGLRESGAPSHTGVPGWANGWVAAAEQANLIGARAPFPIWTEGDLKGDAPVTRAEAATLLANMLELKK